MVHTDLCSSSCALNIFICFINDLRKSAFKKRENMKSSSIDFALSY